jgi:hypothetical protein
VTLKIETIPGAECTSIRLVGRLRAECLPELKAQIEGSGRGIVLEMGDVTLVDVDVVRFLSGCEAQGIQLRRCSAYIREWIAREQERGP